MQEKQPFERIEVSRDQALEMFSENSFKVSDVVPTPFDVFLNTFYINISFLISYFHMGVLLVNTKKLTFLSRLKSLMNCRKIRRSPSIDAGP